MAAELLSPPQPDALPLAEARGFLRLDDETEDALLAACLRSALGLCEAFTGTVLLQSTWQESFADWPLAPVRLGRAPVRGGIAVTIVPVGASVQSLSASAYQTRIDIHGQGELTFWPTGQAISQLSISYSAGLTTHWTLLPEALRLGILRMAAHLFTNRDSASDAGPPLAIAALWSPYRRARVA
jgi:uncharacterized phiE125 gp8 family phage protein